MPPSASKDAVTDVLDNVSTALKETKDLLDLAPVPGLSTAADALLGILEQVKKMRANKATVEVISNEITNMRNIIESVVNKVKSRADKLQREEQDTMWENLKVSDGWQERVEQLQNELQDIQKKAQPCGRGRWYQRLWRATRDEDTLQTIRTDLGDTLKRYRLGGTLSIEALTEETLARLESLAAAQKAEAEKQEEERSKQDEERRKQEEERKRLEEDRQQKIIDKIPHADSAGYRSVSNSDKAEFLAGTRDAVWKRFNEWVSGNKPVCFLIGAAGMGKSTIASEFCRRREEHGDLGASFFFKRGDAHVGSTMLFFTTLAYQLAQSRMALRPYIVRAADHHMRAGRAQQMQLAVEDLLRKPLRDAKDAGVLSAPVYIVIDALDECNESASQPDLVPRCLELLVSCALEYPSSFRVLITSRPHPNHVEEARRKPEIENSSVLVSLYNVEEREAIDRDIEELIRTRLCKVREGAQWHESDPTVVKRLTEQSEGVFVYARTAVDFITGGVGMAQMEDRLQVLLAPGNTYGLDHLDQLYRTVLEAAFPPKDLYPKLHEQLRLLLAWVALCQNSRGITPLEVELISGIPCRESIPILAKLHSVLVFYGTADNINNMYFRAMHVTFRDFLVDERRCGKDFHVDPRTMHTRFAIGCLRGVPTENDPYCGYGKHHGFDHVKQAAPTQELTSMLKEIYTSMFTDGPGLFLTRYFLGETFSLYEVLDPQVVDRDIIGAAIRSRLCAVDEGGQWDQKDPILFIQLATQAEGTALYTRLAVNFIVCGGSTPQMEHRLQLLTPRDTNGLRNLDFLYRTVLETEFPPAEVIPEKLEQVRLVLAWIAVGETSSYSPGVVEELSALPCNDSIPILTKLHPVIVFDPEADDVNNQRRYLVDDTFRRFLVNRVLCGDDFHVHPGLAHARIAVDCLSFLHRHTRTRSRPEYDAASYARACWSGHVGKSIPTTELVGWLKEIFTSVSTNLPSLLFFPSIGSTMDGVGLDLLRWVDKHIGRDLAKIIGAQFELHYRTVTILFEEEVTTQWGIRGAEEQEELRRRCRSQQQHFEKCWIENYPGITFPDEGDSEEE
ncbi:hypothetical protein L227DRAFT_441185 [Lentinus tigrinus ALCF2SS1-6]|uniref:Nephrocystin 3-like N-terminal domain-containing protein n=1 Tax=Lentinus tigrinus ALCF2SS1-6 TaxID=1328759 RepID=A0A5C2RNH2_9APHY|nr:hypothetical protein L227DRAFT_441185 [Lentinus tigrinus ALCF2SS1-6]